MSPNPCRMAKHYFLRIILSNILYSVSRCDMIQKCRWHRQIGSSQEEIAKIDVTFGEIEYDKGCGYTAHKDILFGGKEQSVEVMIMCDDEEELVKKIHLESIVIDSEYVMESKGKNPVYILFNRDWGGEDMDDNGVAVLIEDGEVTEVGYKDIAF